MAVALAASQAGSIMAKRLAHRATILRSEICIETGTLTVPVLAAPAPRGEGGRKPADLLGQGHGFLRCAVIDRSPGGRVIAKQSSYRFAFKYTVRLQGKKVG